MLQARKPNAPTEWMKKLPHMARRLEEQGSLRAHTVMCLLSTAPVIGRRKPSFDSVLKLADAAGLEITLTPRNE